MNDPDIEQLYMLIHLSRKYPTNVSVKQLLLEKKIEMASIGTEVKMIGGSVNKMTGGSMNKLKRRTFIKRVKPTIFNTKKR